MFVRPTLFDPAKVIAAQSTRHGGVSKAPFGSLNLGLSVNDWEADVMENRRRFFEALGIRGEQCSRIYQVHGDRVHVATAAGLTEGYDAQISNVKGLPLLVSVADCTPVLVHDEKQEAVAAIHAGWRGTEAGIVAATLKKMNELFGTEGKHCKAYIGACISFENFEVGEEVAARFENAYKRFDETRQRWKVDLKAANEAQLKAFGIPGEHIEISTHCTVGNNDLYFSHRNEKGITGRMMAVIGLL